MWSLMILLVPSEKEPTSYLASSIRKYIMESATKTCPFYAENGFLSSFMAGLEDNIISSEISAITPYFVRLFIR